MAYNGTYVSEDLDDIAIDGIGTAGVQVIVFVSLIVLVALAVWFRRNTKKLK